MEPTERISSGIAGLDKVIEGGFLRGSLIIISGGVGAGKTTFALQFVYYGCSVLGESALYVLLSEDSNSLRVSASRFGWNIEELEKSGVFYIFEPEEVERENAGRIINQIINRAISLEVKRIVIDSYSPFQLVLDSPTSRLLVHLLYKFSKKSRTNLMLIMEGLNPLTMSESYVADGLIHLEAEYSSNTKRLMKILKMRGTRVEKSVLRFAIGDNGIEVIPNPGVRGVKREISYIENVKEVM